MAIDQATTTPAAYFGWKVVAAAFVVGVFGWGIGFYGPSVFLGTLHAERGWPIWLVSGAITAHFLCSAVVTAYLPEAYGRWGVARVTQAGAGLAALGAVLWANVPAAWQLFPVALVSGAGAAATMGGAINAIVSPWFDRDRPKALGLAFNGASVGGLVCTPLWVALIERLGFAAAGMLMAIATVAILWPVSARYLRPQPDRNSSGGAPAPAASKAALLRNPRFATISTPFALGLFAQVGLFAHLVTRLTGSFGDEGAAWAIGLVSLCAVLGRTLFGWLIGNRDRRNGAALNFVMQACGTVLLALSSGVTPLLCGCVLFGLGVGNLVSLPPLIIQREFAPADVGRAVALTVAINQAVFAFAPAVVGAVRDLAGSYVAAFAVVAAVQLAAAAVVLAGRRRTAPR
jgi:predicted MFS family arabinose efflux permease